LSNLAVFLMQHGKLAEAEPMCRESLEKHRRLSGPTHPYTLIATNVMGFVLLNQNKPAEAEPYEREALAISRRINGEDHPDTVTYAHNLSRSLLEQGKLSEAESGFRDSATRASRSLGAEHPLTVSSTSNLGAVLNQQKRFAQAAQVLSTAEPAARKSSTPAGQRSVALLLTRLGKARAGLKHFQQAEGNLLEGHAIRLKLLGKTHTDTVSSAMAIIDLYTDWNASQPGKGYDRKALEWKAEFGLADLPAEVFARP
jgi:hypothetical protein